MNLSLTAQRWIWPQTIWWPLPQSVSKVWRLTIAICGWIHCDPTCGSLLLWYQNAIEPSTLFCCSFVIICILTHCILNRHSHTMNWKGPISIVGTSGCETYIFLKKKMTKLFANSGDPDQTPRSAASDLGLHCLQITLLGVSRLQ